MPVIYRQRFALLYHQLHALFQHLRNYCFTIIIISLNYRLSIIFTKLSRKTNGTTRFTSCPLPGTKVTICPRSIHRIPNQPYFHVTLTLRFRKVEESGQGTIPCPDLPIAPGHSRGRNVTAGDWQSVIVFEENVD